MNPRIRAYWGDMTPTAKESDKGFLLHQRHLIRGLMEVNQEMCCTPLRHEIDEALCNIYNDLGFHLENLK